MESKKKSNGKFRLIDFLVILLCLSGAVYSVNLFWEDLFQTLNGQNKTPIGSVSIKRNIVQRRMSDRVIWDRLIRESPVYSNDMIRVGDNSEADLHVGGNDITINENTLLRLRYDKETGEYQIDLTSGSLGLITSSEGKEVALNIMGRQVKAKPGTALNAAAGDNGMALQVSEGQAVIAEENQNRELDAGAAIAMDSNGSIRSAPAAFVIQPKPNALYRKSSNEPINIAFSWNRINLQPNETLRLEIAEDQSFSRSVRTLNGLNDEARTALNAGLWNWRLTYNGAVLDSGRFTITDTKGLELLSPAKNRLFTYETEPPKLYFQWSQTDNVSHYILEVDVTPEFRNPIIKKQTAAVSFSDSSLGEGIWYWRVTPVFSQTDDNGINSGTAAFRIVKSKEPLTPSLVFAEELLPSSAEVSAPAAAPTPTPVTAVKPALSQTPSEPNIPPIPFLTAPSNRQPAEGYSIGIEELKKNNINFSWSAVREANGYILTIYKEANGERRQIMQMGPENRTSWSTDIKTLGRGNFIWRIEAVNVGRNNIIEQHGTPAESRFVVDIPRAGPVKIINGLEDIQ
jgi:hypothetical protein